MSEAILLFMLPVMLLIMGLVAYYLLKEGDTKVGSPPPVTQSTPSPPVATNTGTIKHWDGCNYTDECLPSFLCLKSNKNSQGGRCLTTAECEWASGEDKAVGECDKPL
jgi:hypothetical protein